MAGDPAAIAAFDDVARAQLLSPDSIVRVKLWSADGRVLYADESQLIGRSFPLSKEQREALALPATIADVSELDESENAFESADRLVEVYRPVWTPSGQELLFEIYASYDPVGERTTQLWRGFAGVTASSLVLFVVIVAPIVWHLVRRLRRAEEQRIALLQRAVDASADERRRIAATLHDGPVQELAATSFTVAGASATAGAHGQSALARDLTRPRPPCARASGRCAPCSSTSTRRAWPVPGSSPRCTTSPRPPAATTSSCRSTAPTRTTSR